MSKIAAVKAYPIIAKLKNVQWTAQESRADVELLLVEVITDDGVKGYGQVTSTPMPEIKKWVERFGEEVKGMDALARVAVWDHLLSLTSPRPNLGGLSRAARPQIMGAIGGIDMALWDIAGKIANLPIFRLLGGENKPVFTYATGGYYVKGSKLTSCADELAGFVKNGFKAVKLKVGGASMKDEIERVKATRAAIGPDINLKLDLNAAYDLPACYEFAKAVAPYNIFWLEEPLHWYLQPVDFGKLAAATSIPLAHGEREMTRFTARDYMTLGGVRYMMFDATRYAGLTESLRVAHMADEAGVMITPHHSPELHCHLVAAFPRTGYAVESHGSHDRDPIWQGMYLDRAQVKDSYVTMNEKPGWGVELDWKFINSHLAGY